MTMPDNDTQSHRGTILVEDAEILLHDAWPGDQYVLRIHAPKCASRALPRNLSHV